MRYLPILLLMFLSAASAQTPSLSDLDGIHEVSVPISALNPPDRHEILKRLQIVASQLRGEDIKVGSDQTFAIQGYGSELCGATGNCSFWVFDTHHNILLSGIAQRYRYLPERHNGRNDVLTAMHDSAYEADLTRWRFDGHRYRRASCATAAYGDLISGKVYRVPRITPAKCD